MCGIAGIWNKNGSGSPDRVQQMLDQMVHRGPDAEGVWSDGGLTLGNRRLKILDLSDAANQPFTDGQDCLVFNGRIFNYRELREELSDRFAFETQCDTEVLFRALQTWGIDALDRLRGQFAFAHYDSRTSSLFLGRDHVGICPLYVLDTGSGLAFASEIAPLLTLGKRSLNRQGVIDYFAYRYNIQNGHTLFDGIERFPPAHVQKVCLRTGEVHRSRYWRLTFGDVARPGNETQAAFNTILDREIAAQQSVDVPAGMYLSGGIDSGALLAGFSRATQQVKSFTLQFTDADPEAERVAALGERFPFEQNLIPFHDRDLDGLDQDVATLEEPFADLIISANSALAKRASRDVRVVLSGEGGDEAFCGYDHQRGLLKLLGLGRHTALRMLGRVAMQVLPPGLLGRIQGYPGKFGREELVRVREIYARSGRPLEAYLATVSLFSPPEIGQILDGRFLQGTQPKPDTQPFKEIFDLDVDPWRAIMRTEIEQMTLIVNLLKQDRFGMRNSLEGCVPLVSRSVLEFAGSLPFETLYGGVNKHLLLEYSGAPRIAKAPFSLFTTPRYLRKISELTARFVNRDSVASTGVLSWEGIQPEIQALASGQVLGVKRCMSILVFMAWWHRFRGHLNP